MKQESVKSLADGAMTLAVSSGASSYFGWFTFINDNAPGIGVLLSFMFGSIGIIFYYLTLKKSTLADENKRGLIVVAEKLDTHIVETTSQNNELKSGINSILEKLS